MAMERLAVVGVMGSGEEPHADRAVALGEWLAKQGVHLLTGGGGGVMEAVSRAFYKISDRRGSVIGIIPGRAESSDYLPREGYPNRWVELPIFTHLPLSGHRGEEPMSRNHINVLSSDLLVALPGGPGTASEVNLALRYRRPLIAFLKTTDEIPGLPESVLVESELEGVQAFVQTFLTARRGGEEEK